MKMNFKKLLKELDEKGFTKIEGVYSQDVIEEVKAEFEKVKETYTQIQDEAGVLEGSRNATHHTILLCPKMLKLLDPNPIHKFIEHCFGGKYILYTMGASVLKPKGEYVYTQKIHREFYTFIKDTRIMLNTLIMLDDSTEENGATWMIPGSHKVDEIPKKKHFYKNAVRALGKKGDVLVFDANLWHAAGVNNTDKPRTIITPLFTKPYLKQSLDYPKAFGVDFQYKISDELKQTLGYNARVPESLQEFYQPEDKRFYKRDQG